MSLSLGPQPRRRRPSLTPMIDVVFLLVVFFMLASRFGGDSALPLGLAGPGSSYSGPPRLVTITPDAVRLNGFDHPLTELPGALAPLMEAPGDTVVLQPAEGASLQRAVTVMEVLRAAGLSSLVLVGEP